MVKFDPIIAPGQSQVITIRVKTHENWRSKMFSRKSLLFTNDPNNERVNLFTIGTVK